MPKPSDQYDIEVLKKEDIPMIGQIFVDSTRKDLAFVHCYESDFKTSTLLHRHLEKHIDDCTYVHVKAVMKETGLIVGYASWYIPSAETVHKEYLAYGCSTYGNDAYGGDTFGGNTLSGNDHGSSTLQMAPDNPIYSTALQPDFYLNQTYGPLPDASQPDPRTRDRGLFEYLERYFTRWRAKHQDGSRYIRLAGLMVHPTCQRQGLGRKLVEYGFQFSDGWQMRMFALAINSSWPVLHKCGFEGKRFVDVDLRAWVRGAKTSGQGYGWYSFRFVVREPGPDNPQRAAAVAVAEVAAMQTLSEQSSMNEMPPVPPQTGDGSHWPMWTPSFVPGMNLAPSGQAGAELEQSDTLMIQGSTMAMAPFGLDTAAASTEQSSVVAPSDQVFGSTPMDMATGTTSSAADTAVTSSESPAFDSQGDSPSPGINPPPVSPSPQVDSRGRKKKKFRVV